ncbi:MAG: cytochrome c biogenesis protein ResB [Desulfuromonadales bacterium]|nr:cytochrome c biogenesis protein ResB [Desulfuromonadales bacterium]
MMTRTWNLLCSLKLAIWLASLATLLLMGGSLLVPFNGRVFGTMDQVPFATWLAETASKQLSLTWWFWLAALIMILFGLNTLCCFLDWLVHIRARWRKTGEYLLHLGVVLVLLAYIWGSLGGWRNPGLQLRIGVPVELPQWPGHALRLDEFTPLFSGSGPPQDMISQLTLLNGDGESRSARVGINAPLLHNGLVITPVSFGQLPVGLRFLAPDGTRHELHSGDTLHLENGSDLRVLRFVADLQQRSDGSLFFRDDRLGIPAYEVQVGYADGGTWQGWYLPTRGLPHQLKMAGFNLQPVAPVYQNYSILTVNYDPGARLAATGGTLMTIGVLLALFSFYRKRARQDRPEI